MIKHKLEKYRYQQNTFRLYGHWTLCINIIFHAQVVQLIQFLFVFIHKILINQLVNKLVLIWENLFY